MRFYNIQNKFGFTLLFLFSCLTSFSQLNTLSPYSRFGIGELEGGNSVFSNNLGGATVSISPFVSVNYDNPASYSYLISPIFQTSLSHNYTLTESAENSGNTSQSAFKEIVVGSPLGAKWGGSLGVTPYSAVGYNFSERSDFLADGTQSTYFYQGSGGFTKAFIGASRKSTKYNYQKADRGPEIGLDSIKYMASSLSLGINANVIFGSAEYERNIFFDNFNDYYHRLESSTTSIGALRPTFGFLYKKDLGTKFEIKGEKIDKVKQITLQIGGTYDANAFPNNISSRNTHQILTAYTNINTLASIPADTVLFDQDLNGELSIPSRLTLGAGLVIHNSKDNLIELSGQFSTQDWSNFSNSLSAENPELYGSSNTYSFGLQFTPKPLDVLQKGKFLKKTLYQVGYTYRENYVNLSGQNLIEQRVGLGCSIPFLKSKSLSRLNLGMDFGIRGNTENGLIKESSFNAYIGFSLMPNLRIDRWFKQSKYQ